MSLNISSKILDFATTVTVQIDLKKLGPRQKTAFARAYKTGITKGWSVPMRLARHMRKNMGLDCMHYSQRGWADFTGIQHTNDEFYNNLSAYLAAWRMTHGGDMAKAGAYQHKYYEEELREVERAIALRSSKASIGWHICKEDLLEHTMRQVKFMEPTQPAPADGIFDIVMYDHGQETHI